MSKPMVMPKPRRASRVSERRAESKPARNARAKSASPAAATPGSGTSATALIDARIRSLGDWRGETLAEVRRIIRGADPQIVEEWKWMGTPVWSLDGNICTGETYKAVVKLTFVRGAALKDPKKLFNSSLEGNTRRAIDIREGEVVDAEALTQLIRAAVAANQEATVGNPTVRRAKSRAAPARDPVARKGSPRPKASVVLLAGGNPQVAKAYGGAPVQAYIAAIPGWKRGIGERIDALVTSQVPAVRKAVKWNSPFYGVEGQGWFLSFHVFTRYVKATFFRGTSLKPAPPGGTTKEARWIDIHEDDFDDAQMKAWVKQAARVPGWMA